MIEILAVIGKILEYGTMPAVIILTAIVISLVRKIDKNATSDAERHQADKTAQELLKSELLKSLKESEIRTNKQIESSDTKVNALEQRINYVEREYLPRDEHYKEFSGWRAEINRVSDLIIGLWKDKAKAGEKE